MQRRSMYMLCEVPNILTFCSHTEFMSGYSKTTRNLVIHMDT